jgi:hypothetical protein
VSHLKFSLWIQTGMDYHVKFSPRRFKGNLTTTGVDYHFVLLIYSLWFRNRTSDALLRERGDRTEPDSGARMTAVSGDEVSIRCHLPSESSPPSNHPFWNRSMRTQTTGKHIAVRFTHESKVTESTLLPDHSWRASTNQR